MKVKGESHILLTNCATEDGLQDIVDLPEVHSVHHSNNVINPIVPYVWVSITLRGWRRILGSRSSLCSASIAWMTIPSASTRPMASSSTATRWLVIVTRRLSTKLALSKSTFGGILAETQQ